MILPLQTLALGAAFAISSLSLAQALSASDIPADIPVSQLISSATAALAQGNGQDALTYFDVAITRDPQNYLTIFRRGAAYLQLGKHSQASHDFDRVLSIKPTFFIPHNFSFLLISTNNKMRTFLEIQKESLFIAIFWPLDRIISTVRSYLMYGSTLWISPQSIKK